MKNKPYLLKSLFSFFCLTMSLYVHSQHHYWALPPDMIDMQNTAFAATPLPGGMTTQYSNSNAAYDENGNLYFYIQGNGVTGAMELFDPATGLPFYDLGSGHTPNYFCSDLEIVPVPDACKQFYVFYSFPSSLSGTLLFYVKVDCSGASPSVVDGDELTIPGLTFTENQIGLAVSRLITGTNNYRYLFVHYSYSIDRWEITNSGIVFDQSIFNASMLPGFQFQYEYSIHTHELDLYDTGSDKILAWGQEYLNTLVLDANYDVAAPTSDFKKYSETDIKGVEAVSPTRVYTCSPNGIRYFTIGVDSPTTVSASSSFTNTELELTANLKLMCVKNTIGELWYVDNPNAAPSMVQATAYLGTVQSDGFSNLDDIYKLPDQVEYGLDEYDYYQAFPTPTANAGPDVSICPGDQTTLTATGSGTANWYDAGNNLLCGDCPTYDVSPGTTTTYTLIIIDELGCGSDEDDVTVTVFSSPSVSLGPNLELCIGEPVSNITASPCNVLWTYVWSQPPPNNCLDGGCNVNPCNSGTYCVTVTDQNGCTAEDCVNVAYIDCNPCEVTANFNMKSKSCSTLEFNNTSTSNGSTTIVGQVWDFGDGTTSTDVSPTHQFYYNGSYSITLTVFGIDSDGDCCSSTRSTHINIMCACKPAKPIIWVTQNDNCTFNFYESSITAGTSHIIAWEWDFGDGTYGHGSSVSHHYTASGTYTVQLTITAFNGDQCCTREPDKVTVNVQCESSSCNIETEFSTLINGGYVDFTNLSAAIGSTLIYGYLWDFGDGNTSTDQNPSHTYYTPATYKVCLTVFGYSNGQCCSQTICMDVIITEVHKMASGEEENPEKKSSQPTPASWLKQNQPNPFSDQTVIEYMISMEFSKAEIQLFSAEGKVIQTYQVQSEGNGRLVIPAGTLQPGIYTYTLVVDNKVIDAKKMVYIK